MYADFFPQGIATGNAFLERKHELMQLQHNIQSGHHTLLMAPRRWGKTSLAKNVINHIGLTSGDVSFFLCRTGLSVERKIRHCISEALAQHSALETSVFTSVRQFFKQSKKKWSFGIKGVAHVEITPEEENDKGSA